MKMRYFIGLAVLVALAGSCKKNENNDNSSFSAAIEQDNSNRTVLNGNKVYWTPGDQITVYNHDSNHNYTYQGNTNTQLASFTTTGGVQNTTSNYWGFYPADGCSNLNRSNDQFTFSMTSTTQNYVSGGFDEELNPMAGKNTDASNPTVLYFRNAFSILKVNATGNDCAISSIELSTSGASYSLTGTFVFDYSSRTTTLSSGTGNTITLNANTTLTSSVKSFYFVVPPQALANGFTVTFKNGNTVIDHAFAVTQAQVASNYTIAPNKIFQLGMNVEAQGIRNLVPNVTKDTWWTDDGNDTKENSNYGNINGMRFKITSSSEIHIRPNDPVKLIKGHSYYVRFYTQVNDYGGNTNYDFFWPENSNTQIIANSYQTNNNEWKRHSAKVTNWASSVSAVSNNTEYFPRIDINGLGLDNNTHWRYVAGAMLIDLTDAQDKTGVNYPSMTIDQLNSKPYFYGITPSW